MLLLFSAAVLSLWGFYNRSLEIMHENLHDGLIRSAKSLALAVDVEEHSKFTRPEQATSPEFIKTVSNLKRAWRATQGLDPFKYVYTCAVVDGEIHFVVDTTPRGDADHDGVEDHSDIMEPYPEASTVMLHVIATGVANADREPYSDKWGTFLSGYAPFFDANGKVAGLACVDMTLNNYERQVYTLQKVALISVAGAFLLSLIIGLAVWFYHRKLQRSFERLIKANDEALAADHAKSEFLATMSHEIRTPMNGVIGMTDILLQSHLDKDQREHVETILHCGESLMVIINDILDFSKFDAGHLELESLPISLKTCLHETLELFVVKAAEKNIKLIIVINPDCPQTFLGDPTRLKQVLVNLVGNAIKFTDKGEVRIVVAPAKANEGREGLKFMISDTGIGISREKIPRLFQTFSQGDSSTTRQYGGTGLGLAICDHLTHAMGGHIWVESVSGEGSSFCFIIQATPVDVSVTDVSHGNVPQTLLLASERITQMLVKNFMEKLHRPVTTVTTLDEAVSAVASSRYDIILVELSPTLGTSADVVNRIREAAVQNASTLKIIALATNDSPERMAVIKQNGFHAMLRKPVTLDELQKVMTSVKG